MLLDVPNDIARLFVMKQIATKMLLEEPFNTHEEMRFSEELMLDVEVEDGLAQITLYDTALRSIISTGVPSTTLTSPANHTRQGLQREHSIGSAYLNTRAPLYRVTCFTRSHVAGEHVYGLH